MLTGSNGARIALAMPCGVGLMFTPAANACLRSFREGKRPPAAA
jgi:hypothetical protein